MPPIRAALRGRQTATALLVVLALSTAGCVGGNGAPQSVEPTATKGDAAAPVKDSAGNAFARYDLPAPVAKTVWANGTFKFQENFFPVNFVPAALGLLPPPGLRFVDVSESVPRNVPVRIIAEVNAKVTDGDVDLWIDAPFDEVWSGTWDTPRGGHSKIELRIVHASDKPVRVGLFYDEMDRSVDFPYELRVDVQAQADRLVETIGGALDVPEANSTLIVNLIGPGKEPALLVWGPDTKLLDRFDLKDGANEIHLAEAGQHILALAQGSGDATVAVQGVTEPLPMRAAKQEIVEFMESTTESQAAWSFTTDREPLQVGFFANAGTVADDFTGSLTSPAGKLLNVEASDDLPWVRPVAGFGIGEWTAMGAKGLVRGQYDFKVAFAHSAGPDPMHYGHFIVFMAAP